MKYVFAIIVFAINIVACEIDKNIFYSILMNEAPKGKVGYEYLISFNNSSDVKILKKTQIKSYFLDNRTIDCKNKELCSYILYSLTKSNITNLDLGAFQINYKVHNLEKLSDYFDINKSYKFACNYLKSCIKQYNYTWQGIACYHSKTPHYNEKYRLKLKRNYERVGELPNR